MSKKNLKLRKLQTSEVIEDLQKNGTMTIGALARKHEVTSPTVKSRIKEARHDGVNIVPIIGKNGGVALRDGINNTDEANETLNTNIWICKIISGLSTIGKIQMQLTKQAKKLLSDKMTKEERQIMSNNLLRIKQIVDVIDIDGE